MYCLNDSEIDFILADITRRGISNESICDNLVDHICILVEERLEENGDFANCYSKVIQSFYREELMEIEEAAHILTNYKNHWALSRTGFFLLLFVIFIGPFIAYDITWIINSWETTRWNIPMRVWGPSLTYSLWPLLILLVIVLTPERLDPLIPRKSFILLGIRPFIKVIISDQGYPLP